MIQVNNQQSKFYKSDIVDENSFFKVRMTYTKGNTAQGPKIISTREIPHKVQAAPLIDGNPATGLTNTVQQRKLYYILLPTV